MNITKAAIQAWINQLCEHYPCLYECEFNICQIIIPGNSHFVITVKPESWEQLLEVKRDYTQIQTHADDLKICFIPISPDSTFDIQQWSKQAQIKRINPATLSEIYNELKTEAL